MIIEKLNEGEIYYTKGHVGKCDFVQALNSELFSLYGTTPDETGAETSIVKHSHARCIPAPKGHEYVYYFHFDQKPGRGAFPVTYVYL